MAGSRSRSRLGWDGSNCLATITRQLSQLVDRKSVMKPEQSWDKFSQKSAPQPFQLFLTRQHLVHYDPILDHRGQHVSAFRRVRLPVSPSDIPIALFGDSSLSFLCKALSFPRASRSDINERSYRHFECSSHLAGSMTASSVGLRGGHRALRRSGKAIKSWVEIRTSWHCPFGSLGGPPISPPTRSGPVRN